MTRFAQLSDIASGIVQRIKDGAAGEFKLVTHAQATTGAQIWDMLQAMTGIPGCVVAVGSGDYGPDALKRTVRVMIFVVNSFARGSAAAADGIWQRVETVQNLFLPDQVDGGGFDYPEICGIAFAPVSWNPVESDDSVCAFCLVLEGTEFLQREETI